eukprot:7145576-Lingulodinium_polyedra.AAC.1
MEYAGARFANRSGNEWPLRSIRCATSAKRYTTMRSNRPLAATTARKSRARALHARSKLLLRARGAEAWRF